MQTYLKTRPAWVQLLLFLGMAFGLFMVVYLVGVVIFSRVTGLGFTELGDPKQWDYTEPITMTIIRFNLLMQFLGLFVIPTLLFGYFSDPHPRRYLGLQPTTAFYYIAGIAVLLLALPLVEFTGLVNRNVNFGPGIQQWAQTMEEEAAKTIQYMLRNNTTADMLLNIVFIALFAGVGEELFFRGVLQRIFIKATKSPWVGIIITAFIFSFFHFQFFGFVPRLLLGVLLGVIYWYSGSLWPAILAHFIYDAFFIILAYNRPELVMDTDASLLSGTALYAGAAVSLAIITALVWLMKKRSTVRYADVYNDDENELPPLNRTY